MDSPLDRWQRIAPDSLAIALILSHGPAEFAQTCSTGTNYGSAQESQSDWTLNHNLIDAAILAHQSHNSNVIWISGYSPEWPRWRICSRNSNNAEKERRDLSGKTAFQFGGDQSTGNWFRLVRCFLRSPGRATICNMLFPGGHAVTRSSIMNRTTPCLLRSRAQSTLQTRKCPSNWGLVDRHYGVGEKRAGFQPGCDIEHAKSCSRVMRSTQSSCSPITWSQLNWDAAVRSDSAFSGAVRNRSDDD